MSRAWTGRERVRWRWGPGGCRGLPGAPAVLGGGSRPVVSPRRSSSAIAARSPSPAPGLSQLQRLRLAAPSRAAASLLISSFSSHFWGWGDRRLRKCTQGRRPGRAGSVSGALHAHPARGRRGSGEHRGVRDPSTEPRALPEGLSHPRTPAPPPRRPCFCLLLGLNRPAGVLRENRSPHPRTPLPPFLFEVVFSF